MGCGAAIACGRGGNLSGGSGGSGFRGGSGIVPGKGAKGSRSVGLALAWTLTWASNSCCLRDLFVVAISPYEGAACLKTAEIRGREFGVAGAGLNIDLLVRVETETVLFVVELGVGLAVGLEEVVAVEVAIGVDTPLLHAFSHRVAVARNRIWYKLRIVVLRHNCSVKI